MAHYYDELRDIFTAEVNEEIKNGVIKPEDREKSLIRLYQWLDWPGWNRLDYRGKSYYKDFGAMLFMRAMYYSFWVVSSGIIFAVAWKIFNLL